MAKDDNYIISPIILYYYWELFIYVPIYILYYIYTLYIYKLQLILMDMHGCAWICMDVYGNVTISLVIRIVMVQIVT